MALYIGFIDIRTNFYNFKPLARIESNNTLEILTSLDRKELLPESRNENINLFYDYRQTEQSDFMKSTFHFSSLFALQFELDDLEDNYTSDGYTRNATGYKINAYKAYIDNKLKTIESCGFYYLISKQNLSDDLNIFREKIIFLKGVVKGAYVLASFDNDVLFGPYFVDEREQDRATYIMPKVKEHLYVAEGYKNKNCIKYVLQDFRENLQWEIAYVNKQSEKEYVDVSTDSELIENFKDSVCDNPQFNTISLDELWNKINNSNCSLISSSTLPDSIRENRLERVKKLLESVQNLSEGFDSISSVVSNSVIKFIQSNPDTEESDLIVKKILDNDPNCIEKIREQRLIAAKVDQYKQEISVLESEKESVNSEIAALKEDLDKIKESINSAENIESLKQSKNEEIKKLETKIQEERKTLEKIQETVEAVKSIEILKQDRKKLEDRIKALHEQETYATESFNEIFNKNQKKMQEIVFDGFVSNKLIQAASCWESQEKDSRINTLLEKEKAIEIVDLSPDELIEYLCSRILIARPSYTHNVIVNIAVCMFQGFLTVFSGEPGCGKTSICNLMADVLGLSRLHDLFEDDAENSDRYVQVSVERGWTSKRDLIGYYNPLSKSFDKSDRRLFDGLTLLSLEKKSGLAKFPYVVLLDEANLSPMEYYWADFMNVCDDLKRNNKINFGEDFVFSIPETLRFVATINNDHTTETLSPRLIDRAWIVTLPQFTYTSYGRDIPNDQLKFVSWKSIKDAFVPEIAPGYDLPEDIKKVYEDKIKVYLKKMHITVSNRTDLAIKRYFMVASKFFVKESEYEDARLIALDYAIAQKILPRIHGNGKDFKTLLDGLKDICRDNNLYESQLRIQEMIDHGNDQMGYYNFFN